MVESTALEKRQGRKLLEGSNPSLSAMNVVNKGGGGFESRSATARGGVAGVFTRKRPVTKSLPFRSERSEQNNKVDFITKFATMIFIRAVSSVGRAPH